MTLRPTIQRTDMSAHKQEHGSVTSLLGNYDRQTDRSTIQRTTMKTHKQVTLPERGSEETDWFKPEKYAQGNAKNCLGKTAALAVLRTTNE